MNISFDNTENAFAYKTNKQLKMARFLFKTMDNPVLIQLGIRLSPLAIKLGLPVKGLIRKSIFQQFVGGESLLETASVSETLNKYGVKVILDYGVESKQGEDSFEHTTDEFINVIKYASTKKNIPFVSVKITGIARFALLQRLNDAPRIRSGVHDNEAEAEEWERVRDRMYRICNAAAENNIGVLVDAEESWIQDPVDRLTMEMMEEFNQEKVIVYNTIQLYRTDRLQFLHMSHRIAQKNNFMLGVKLVRGAYMEKERERAASKGYPSPIQPNKQASDDDYNAAVLFCFSQISDTACIIATHNEESNLLAAQLMEKNGLPSNHPHVHFSQLYGMSDNITFNLANEGFSVSKYLPFGPINDVIPYLMRRARENKSVSGQTGRELALIEKELKRRKEAGIK